MHSIVAPYVKPGETAVIFDIGGRVRPTPKKLSNIKRLSYGEHMVAAFILAGTEGGEHATRH